MKRSPLRRTGFKRKKPKKRAKKTTRQKLVAELDRVFSLYIRARDAIETGGVCWFCRTKPIECCFHVIRRGKMSVRWAEYNAKGSCHTDNYKENYDNHPFILQYIQAHGKEQYENLVQEGYQIRKFEIYELEEMLSIYKEKLAPIEAEGSIILGKS